MISKEYINDFYKQFEKLNDNFEKNKQNYFSNGIWIILGKTRVKRIIVRNERN